MSLSYIERSPDHGHSIFGLSKLQDQSIHNDVNRCQNDTRAKSPRDHCDSCIYTFAISVPSLVCMSLQPNFTCVKRNDCRTSCSTTFERPVVDVFTKSHTLIRKESHHLRFVVKSVHRSPQIAHKVRKLGQGLIRHPFVAIAPRDDIVVDQHSVFD